MIKVGILGYGNIGKGVELAVNNTPDMELVAIFSRRDGVKLANNKVSVNISEIEKFKDKIDVLILCGGSATDLPEQAPQMLKNFNTVDSFDTHAKIPNYFESMDKVGKASKKLGLISVGWDPGLFSIMRVLFEAMLPGSNNYTFWGKGVSQGHSDAIRRVDGVKYGIQYTLPVESAVSAVKEGKNPKLSPRDKHTRECFVVVEEGANKAKVEADIKTMPNYFNDYNTIVNFVTAEEFKQNHSKMPHGGLVINSGTTNDNTQIMEFNLKLGSNPEFTASAITAYARAVYKMASEGCCGAITVFDVSLKNLSAISETELRKLYL